MQQPEILATEPNLVPTGTERKKSSEMDALPTETVALDATSWRTAIKLAIRSTAELRSRLELPPEDDGGAESDFPTFVPLELLARIEPKNETDPILRQVLPTASERRVVPGFGPDPVGDLNKLPAKGIVHKYDGRSLMITTGACGVHCRYCFRREFPYGELSGQSENWDASIQYVREHAEIDEVILSGGDPLTLVDEKLSQLVSEIESIDHVNRLRIHSRMPIVIPQRVTQELVQCLSDSSLAVWFVVHVNHANEWDDSVRNAVAQLINAGIPVLNQAVLLREVNDNVDALVDLCRTLVNDRVQPYYLHQLDRVSGAAHFEVPQSEGLQLVDQLRRKLPGYAVPNYVIEESGEPSKTPLT